MLSKMTRRVAVGKARFPFEGRATALRGEVRAGMGQVPATLSSPLCATEA